MRAAQQLRQQPFSLLDRPPAQILAVELEQVKGAMYGCRDCAVAADQIKDSEPVVIANNRFAVDQARANAKLTHRHCNKRNPGREIVSGAGDQPHAGTIPARQDPEAIMIDFVQPSRTGRRGLSG